jgi:putative tryptophan/tyrosine transport system substrate-binding protein
MTRREFITLLGGSAAAWPLAARAQQQGEQIRHIGVLCGLAEDDPEMRARLAAFRQELEKRGWSEGRTVRIDTRFAPGGSIDQAGALAKELLAAQPAVIVAMATPATTALQRATSVIPIVFVHVADPVGSGFVDSLARPGRNLTGLLLFESGIVGKWLAMLKEIAPRLRRAALVFNPKTAPFVDYYRGSAETAASSLGIELMLNPIDNAATDIERSLELFARVPDSGLVVLPDVTTVAHRDLIIALATRFRLPAAYSLRSFVSAGGLMAYSTDRVDQFRQAASYVDRILRGANPADLPVLAPTKYDTALNLKTAKALGLMVPPGLLVAADEVIE